MLIYFEHFVIGDQDMNMNSAKNTKRKKKKKNTQKKLIAIREILKLRF